MKHSFPIYLNGHMMALAGVTALHTGIAAWAMSPQPPVAIEQQVIQITMVAPTVVQQEEIPQVQEMKKETPKVPPKETGMVKAESKPEPVQEAKKQPEKQAQPQQLAQQTQLTSGLQADEATDKNAAITEPVAAAYLKNPPPEYPARARSRRQQGTVMIEVRVTPDGNPRNLEISRSSGHKLLDTAALDAVKRWKFVPARRGSQVVEASVVVPVEFRIN